VDPVSDQLLFIKSGSAGKYEDNHWCLTGNINETTITSVKAANGLAVREPRLAEKKLSVLRIE
jgi:hypothetical protein